MTKASYNQSALTGPERAAMLAGAVVVHLGLLALILSTGSTSAISDARPGVMSLISIAPQPARASPPPPDLPSKIRDANRVVAKMESSADSEANPAGASAGCATLEVINKAIVADPAAVTAVLASPRESRSIAEAVILWNDGWIGNATAADAPLAPARLVVEQSLASIAPECLDEPIAGPRLVPVPAGSGTMFLVIGSGAWTWRQLLEQPNTVAASEVNSTDSMLGGLVKWFRPLSPERRSASVAPLEGDPR